ncbi:SDR family oxidoreductase [Rhodococcus fascians]|nr:SDR family oxidoreductase [Rhodococcus fascians]MBY4238738.1 SDR family oxidoreductase [Rhodococcus fascians]MBY4254673.1 SDR family oxidoreductase [Rhodococcus fascians]MBY4270093.1 SDR family oxidoreductase [Rhodococcus fascians]
MGRASARLFAREGAHVVVVDLNETAANETSELIAQDGGKSSVFACDASDLEQIRALFDKVETDHGALHVLYSHLGIPGAAGMEVTEAEWDRSIDLNMKSAFFSAQYALPLLRKAEGKGSVIFTASTTGLVGSPYSPLYSTTKGGVVMLAKALAVHVAKDGIRANVICPGPIDTPMLPEFFGRPGTVGESGLDDELKGFISTAVPLGRAGTADEIASAALFLASDDSSFITGVALPVDGGFTAK